MATVVACAVFRTELEHLLGADAGVTFLPAGLHVSEARLGRALEEALGTEAGAACFYGACHPDLDGRLAELGGTRLGAKNCIAAFLSPEQQAELGEHVFIMSPGWLSAWRSIFVEGLGWDNVDARLNFGAYEKVVVLDFGLEPIDDLAVLEFFDFAQTEVEIAPASLDYFRARVEETLRELD